MSHPSHHDKHWLLLTHHIIITLVYIIFSSVFSLLVTVTTTVKDRRPLWETFGMKHTITHTLPTHSSFPVGPGSQSPMSS